ncbi:MAG: sugar phosphate isomerase/epimerase [Lentisphaeria bacterium]|nr:sugar phosphate isomerase/epimerase [Lentisphaeria bacterium]
MQLCMMTVMMANYAVEDIVKTAVECRMPAIDWISCHGKDPKYLKRLCDDAGLVIAAHTIFSQEALTTGVQPRECFLRSLADAVALGTHTMMVPPFPDDSIADLSEARKRWIDFYAWAAPIGKAAGVQITCEPTGFINSPITSADEIRETLDAVPDLKLTFDVGNMATADMDLVGGYQKLKDAIVHFHLKDWTITDQPTAISDLKRTGKHFANAIINRGALALRNWWINVDPAQKNLYVNLETSDPQNVIPPHELMKMLSDELRNW